MQRRPKKTDLRHLSLIGDCKQLKQFLYPVLAIAMSSQEYNPRLAKDSCADKCTLEPTSDVFITQSPQKKKKKYSVALVRERPPPVGEVVLFL